MGRISRFLWSLAERADWYAWPPKKLWRRMLRHYDRKAGMFNKPKPDPSVGDCQSSGEPGEAT
ncbi:hypothetical protein LCGC14_1040690 [marine sediment metagenome]|uniref:Uncharacterized protein n=1 Tax=marine sediment metagenome TaxID=412755 RepID=A0A0F9MW64_9ZZZZ